MKGVVSVEQPDDAPRGPGSLSRILIKEGGRVAEYQVRVTGFEPPRHLAIAMTGKTFGTAVMSVDYRLTDLGGRTRLDYLAFFESPASSSGS